VVIKLFVQLKTEGYIVKRHNKSSCAFNPR
jgi:hypothetical protein